MMLHLSLCGQHILAIKSRVLRGKVMYKNCVEDICNTLNDILFVCELLNHDIRWKQIDDAIANIKQDIEEIASKYT